MKHRNSIWTTIFAGVLLSLVLLMASVATEAQSTSFHFEFNSRSHHSHVIFHDSSYRSHYNWNRHRDYRHPRLNERRFIHPRERAWREGKKFYDCRYIYDYHYDRYMKVCR